MARTVRYCLSDPGLTIYQRAALGGLAATIQAWGKSPPEGITATFSSTEVTLGWGNDLTDREATDRILQAAFRLTKDQLIDLPGHQLPPDRVDTRAAIHDGICATFLQHPKKRPGPGGERMIVLMSDEEPVPISYKPVSQYTHQNTLPDKVIECDKNGDWPPSVQIPQSLIPGAIAGAESLTTTAAQGLLLAFLMVGSAVFLVRAGKGNEKANACIVLPDVRDLKRFAKSVSRMANGRCGTYLGRFAGGVEEAALAFLLDLETEQMGEDCGVSGAQAIAMGRVAWGGKNQNYRSLSVRMGRSYAEGRVFLAARTHLSHTKLLKKKDGNGFAIPASPIPQLVAANLGANLHWCTSFRDLVAERKDFRNILTQSKGISHMKEAIESREDVALIDSFHAAWNMTMGALANRASTEGASFERLVEVERERIRNAILRAKTGEALANWFLRFCAEATRGASLGPVRSNATIMRQFLFNPRNSDRLQNLLLFALVSYSGENFRRNAETTVGSQKQEN